MKRLSTLLLLAAALLAGTTARAQWSTSAAQNTVVRDASGVQEQVPLTAPGPNGGTYVSWFESVSGGGNYAARLQLLDVNGRPQLGAAGLLVSSQPQATALYRYDLKSDALGNAVLAFQDIRSNGVSQVVIYKISPAGQQLWGANGIQLLDPTANQGLSPTIGFTAQGNVVVGWNAGATADATHGTKLVPVVKLSPAGSFIWAAPVRIQGPSRRFSRPTFVPVPGTDDVLVQYVEETGTGLGTSTMYAQRYNAGGTAVWTAATQVSTKTIPFAFFPELLPDGSGGYFVQVNTGNPANASINDVYVQHLAADGTLPWGVTGSEVLAGASTQRTHGMLQYLATRGELWSAVNELDLSQGQSGVTVQRLSAATGAVQLGTSGQVVQPISNTYYAALGLRDTGTGLLVVYSANSGALYRLLYATKLTYQGQPATGFTTPVTLSSVVSTKLNYSTLPFSNGHLVTVWQDERSGDGIYAQTIGDTGALGTLLGSTAATPAQALALSPNPGAAPVLHLTAARSQTAALLVRDLAGRLVWQADAPLAAGANDVPLAAPATLAAGLYLVEATVDGIPWRGRWLKP